MAETNDILLEELNNIKAMLAAGMLSKKKVLTFEEACIYTGRSRSDMYKKTAACQVPHYKPEGKMVYFDVEELAAWCLRNPVKTTEQIEQEAATLLTLGKRRGR